METSDTKTSSTVMPECSVCGLRKKPYGRDTMVNGYCDHECVGYYAEPLAGYLWPGEDPLELDNDVV